jgi:hypothetical protein
MAINANHPFEDLNGIRCAVVEKNCSTSRVAFLKYILEGNGFDVVVAASPPPKAPPAAKPAAAVADQPAPEPAPAESPAAPPPPESFTVGVTDVTFNVINAIYGRLLRSPEGRVVTMAYWQQKEDVSRDDIPYYARD